MPNKKGAPKGKPHNYPANRKSSPRLDPLAKVPADDIQKALSAALYWSRFEPVHNDDECAERLNLFFDKVVELHHHPTVEKLALALGTTRQVLYDWEHGSQGLTRSDMIKKAKQIIADIDAELAMKQKISPVVYIFRAKNYYGMQDQVKVLSESTNTEKNLTDEDIRAMIRPTSSTDTHKKI